MNERIKELALRAGAVNVWEWASDDVLDTKNMDAKKFAELIVKEVLDEVLQAMDDGMDVYDTVADKFGVEE